VPEEKLLLSFHPGSGLALVKPKWLSLYRTPSGIEAFVSGSCLAFDSSPHVFSLTGYLDGTKAGRQPK
jgi:hypothetical protein